MAVPPPLKKIQPYLTISKQFRQRDPVVAYYLKLYAVQDGMSAAKGDSACKSYIFSVMDELEQIKDELKMNPDFRECLTDDMVGQAHVENTALKLFEFADKSDRSSQFNKGVIRAFFTASQILSCLTQFGELDEEIEKKMKYAKWKAVEIDRCLKNGITPTPGPPASPEQEDEFGGPTPGGLPVPHPNFGVGGGADPGPSTSSYYPPSPSNQDRPVPMPRNNHPHNTASGPSSDFSSFPQPGGPPMSSSYNPYPSYPPPPSSEGGGAYPGMGANQSGSSYSSGESIPAASTGGGGGGGGGVAVKLGPEQVVQAQKYCKFATSSLDYDDSEGAIDYLTKALHLLKTGRDK